MPMDIFSLVYVLTFFLFHATFSHSSCSYLQVELLCIYHMDMETFFSSTSNLVYSREDLLASRSQGNASGVIPSAVEMLWM